MRIPWKFFQPRLPRGAGGWAEVGGKEDEPGGLRQARPHPRPGLATWPRTLPAVGVRVHLPHQGAVLVDRSAGLGGQVQERAGATATAPADPLDDLGVGVGQLRQRASQLLLVSVGVITSEGAGGGATSLPPHPVLTSGTQESSPVSVEKGVGGLPLYSTEATEGVALLSLRLLEPHLQPQTRWPRVPLYLATQIRALEPARLCPHTKAPTSRAMSVPPSLHMDPAPSSPFVHTHPSLPSPLGQKRLTQLLNHSQHQALLTACWLNGGKRSFLVVPSYILVCRLCQISSKGSDSILLLPPQKPAVAPYCPHTEPTPHPTSTVSFHTPRQLGLPPLGLPTPHSFQPPCICLPNINFPLSLPKQFSFSFKACPKISPHRSFP